MNLKSLELNGFKSFAKKTELDFGVSIVAIVGPNGSGKSNVAEAFRFVLGEQSMKSMRGKRGEDLIFNGGKNAPKLNRGSVKLIFDNRKKLFKIDFDEVSIERVVHRDGANEYLINGSQVRLRDVLELLADANIGASGHHIISQGEADRMLNASIKERKQMIEDALGLKIYQYKKQESERKLEKTAENIKQVNALRKEIAPHIKFLEKQLEKVERAEDVRRELTALYQEYLSREESYLFNEEKSISNERRAPSEELASIDLRVKKIKEALAEDTLDEKSKKLIRLENELDLRLAKEEGFRSEIYRIEGSLAAEEKILAKARGTQGALSFVSISMEEARSLKKEVDLIVDEGRSSSDISLIKSLLMKVSSIFESFLKRKEEDIKKEDLLDSEKELNLLKSRKAKLEEELSEIKKGISDLKKEAAAIREEMDKENRAGREAEREMFSLLNKRGELVVLLQSFKNRLDVLERDRLAFKEELKEAEVLIGISGLHYKSASFNDGEERSLQEKRRKNLEKLKIRLEELGGAGGDDVRNEYKEATERDQFLMGEIEDLEKSADTLKKLISDLEERLESEFKSGIEKINREFERYFSLMFGGGSASLFVIKTEKRKKKQGVLDDVLGDEGDTGFEEEIEEEDGIDINVSLPNKRIKGLNMLSGGERALVSIALLFAISQVNPPPFVILDETDAALDEANSKKYGDMVENLAKHSQLILITHNRETMSRAGILYGVTMGLEGFSKLLSVKFEEAVAVAK